MLGRVLVCAIAMGIAAPALAKDEAQPQHERASVTLPDTLPLLMLDQQATWGTTAPLAQFAPGFNMAAPITITAAPHMPADLASFEALGAPIAAFAYLPAPADASDTPMIEVVSYTLTPGIRLTARTRAEPMGGATGALTLSNAVPRYHPRRTPFEAMLVLHIDGETDSPPIRFGGGVASVLNVIPRQ